jgi:hypothetical protein
VAKSNVNPSSMATGYALAPGTRDGTSLLGLFAVAILIWAVDFKAQTSQAAAWFQGPLLGIYMVCFIGISILAKRSDIGTGALWPLILATAVFMIESSVVGLSSDQPLYAILVNLVPVFLYISASLLTYMTLEAVSANPRLFINVLRWECIVFAATHVLVVSFARDTINAGTSRFEVLSGAVIPSLSIVAVGLIQRLSGVDVLILVLSFMVSLLSVTRTLLVVLFVQIMSMFVVRPSVLFKGSTFKGLALGICTILLVLAMDWGAETHLAERWIQRITVARRVGADPTALTRSAETHFMMESFASSPESALFGHGLAAKTSLTGPDAAAAARIVGRGSVSLHMIGFGHENYASILFVAGVLGGGGLLILQFLNGFQSIALIRRLQITRANQDASVVHIGTWGALIVIGFVVDSFLTPTFVDRNTCLWYGIGTGMLYWARKEAKVLRLDSHQTSG